MPIAAINARFNFAVTNMRIGMSDLARADQTIDEVNAAIMLLQEAQDLFLRLTNAVQAKEAKEAKDKLELSQEECQKQGIFHKSIAKALV